MTYTADDVLRVLEALPRDATIKHALSESSTGKFYWFDNPVYELPGGWKITAFIDQDEWDYVDHAWGPDGSDIEVEFEHPLFNWSPDADDPRWGLRCAMPDRPR